MYTFLIVQDKTARDTSDKKVLKLMLLRKLKGKSFSRNHLPLASAIDPKEIWQCSIISFKRWVHMEFCSLPNDQSLSSICTATSNHAYILIEHGIQVPYLPLSQTMWDSLLNNHPHCSYTMVSLWKLQLFSLFYLHSA